MIIAGYRRAAGQLSRFRDAGLLTARLILGWLMLLHALRKFSAPGGIASFQHFLASLPNIPFPVFTGAVIPWLEAVGAVALIIGALTRVAAIVLAVELAVITVLFKFSDAHAGVIAPPQAPTAGAEVEFLCLAGLLVLFLLGPGRISADTLAGLEARPQPAARPEPAASRHAGLGS